MSVIDRPLISTDEYGKPADPARKTYLNESSGILSWLFTLDHKRIGLMYMWTVLSAFALGGFFAIMLRTELAMPGLQFFAGNENQSRNFYNQMFTLHGAVMVFMFIIPAIPAILGNFALPMQLGAKDVAFPRLNLLSFYCYIGGALFFAWLLLGGIVVGALKLSPTDYPWLPMGLDTGWTFYTPYSTTTNTGTIAATMGAFILGFSSILTGLNFIATIHMLRPKGMSFFKMPLFLWGLYATSIIQILATPVLAITLLLLTMENVLGIGVFDPALGGDPVLFQHFFWFYSHPAVYIMILPGLGIISELISVFSRKSVFGYKFIAFSSIAIAMFGFIVWAHHMFTSGMAPVMGGVFSLLTMSVAIPSAIKVFNWLETMRKGSIRLDTPMLYAIGFIWLFTIGGLTGLFLATISTDIHFHDTYFIVAHFHYVMVGSTLFAFLGGMYYWFPKMFGRMYDEMMGRLGCAIVFVGFNLTFFIQFIAGSQGMPRRYADFPEQFGTFHLVSTVGAYVLLAGLLLVLFNWVHGAWRGKTAPANPWGANSLEWHTPSPPPHLNFDYDPIGTEPYDFDNWDWDPEIEGYTLKRPPALEDLEKAH